MSPELDMLDQLLGGDMSLRLVRALFESQERFTRALSLMLSAGEVCLIGVEGTEVPYWQWRAALGGGVEAQLSITEAGARRIC